MQAWLQMTERERIIKIRKPSLDNSLVSTPNIVAKKEQVLFVLLSISLNFSRSGLKINFHSSRLIEILHYLCTQNEFYENKNYQDPLSEGLRHYRHAAGACQVRVPLGGNGRKQ